MIFADNGLIIVHSLSELKRKQNKQKTKKNFTPSFYDSLRSVVWYGMFFVRDQQKYRGWTRGILKIAHFIKFKSHVLIMEILVDINFI